MKDTANTSKRRRYVACGLAAVVAAALFAGCPSGPSGPTVAQVNKDFLTRDEFAAIVPEGYSITRENLPRILDKWVSNSLLYQEAQRRGIDKEKEVQLYVKRLQRDYLVNEMLERITSSVVPSQAQLLEYFDQHKEEFSYEVKITRIVLSDSALAAKTLWEIRQGGDFKKLAKERSQDMLLEAGEESRYFARGVGDPRMGGDPAVEEVIFALEPGEVSDVIPSQEGFQIIKLVDKKKVKGEVSFSEEKEYVTAVVTYRLSQEAVDEMLTSLREKATIELTPDVYFE
jgi:peptidyl-prolyl cis-trans isomerase C